MDYAEARQIKQRLEDNERKLGARMREFPSGPAGLTPDEVKSSAEFIVAKRDYEAAFRKLRAYNQRFMKKFRREYLEERRTVGHAP